MQKISERSGAAGKIGDETDPKKHRAIARKRNNLRHLKTEKTCKLILKNKKSLWPFFEIEGIESTDNLAERGNRFVERMMTTET